MKQNISINTTDPMKLCVILTDIIESVEPVLQEIAEKDFAARCAYLHDQYYLEKKTVNLNIVETVRQDLKIKQSQEEYSVKLEIVDATNDVSLGVLDTQYKEVVDCVLQHPKVQYYAYPLKSNKREYCLVGPIKATGKDIQKYLPTFWNRVRHAALDGCFQKYIFDNKPCVMNQDIVQDFKLWLDTTEGRQCYAAAIVVLENKLPKTISL